MKKTTSVYFSLFIILISTLLIIGNSGCANIIPPVGGPKDSLPPVLISATPKDSSVNFTGNRIVLNFNEYVEVQNTFENVLVSPTPVTVPNITYHFRTVNIKLRDTLEPNTTYSINFGDALKDVNEGNINKEFTYVFSTGRTIDQNRLSGKVILAETGKIDSTLIVVLHRNFDDSAVAKDKPRYIARLDGKGRFHFNNLPEGTFAMYAIPNEFSHHYDDTTRPFAFLDKPVVTTDSTPINLYAYTLAKPDTVATAKKKTEKTSDRKQDKQLRFQTTLEAGRQDILKTLRLTFSKPVTTYDSAKIILADKDLKPLNNYTIAADTNKTAFIISYKWPASTDFNLLIDKNAFKDTAGLTLAKNDTIKFTTKREEDYGSIRLRFKNLDISKNPVLQIVQSDKIIESIPLTGREWNQKLFEPGEYDLRILYDTNKNGVWDHGKFFGEHRQPEIVITLNTKLAIRGNWDNEKDITL